ncbi:hypothetical protein AB1Y20_000717 [Prymnesium parvum]|uniref:Uncharacterized protein n=1 Tax=Prymnesium parvum TaxID=97485 RepID=A0AB34K9F7_PRYPA
MDSVSKGLAVLLEAGRRDRINAMDELRQGKKYGHWIWFVFPTLAARGGDMFSAMQVNGAGADLRNEQEAAAYAVHPELRSNLVDAFNTLESAMAKHHSQAPWKVLDEEFGREAVGEWLNGPVDSFKVWASATLFATLAYRKGDDELRQAALNVLSHFKGDVIYSAGGKGTSGHVHGPASNQMYVLKGPDQETLRILGETNWSAIAGDSTKNEL